MNPFVKGLCAAAILTTLSGCAGYQLGSSAPKELRSIAVPTFENASGHPFVEAAATQAVLAELRRDGTLRIADRENAALELEGRVTGCHLDPMRFDRNSPTLAVEYRLTLTADIKVYERATGKVVARLKSVTGDDLFRTQSDLPSAERDAIPRAAARLAKTVVSETLMAW